MIDIATPMHDAWRLNTCLHCMQAIEIAAWGQWLHLDGTQNCRTGPKAEPAWKGSLACLHCSLPIREAWGSERAYGDWYHKDTGNPFCKAENDQGATMSKDKAPEVSDHAKETGEASRRAVAYVEPADGYVEPPVTYRTSRTFDCGHDQIRFTEHAGGILVEIISGPDLEAAVTLTPEQWKDLQSSTYHLKPR